MIPILAETFQQTELAREKLFLGVLGTFLFFFLVAALPIAALVALAVGRVIRKSFRIANDFDDYLTHQEN